MKPKVGVGIFIFFSSYNLSGRFHELESFSYPFKENLMNFKASPYSVIEEIMNLIISSTLH